MKDRVSTEVLSNGAIRYAEYDSSGNLIGYKYFKPADEPSEDGTPINKATLLKDATAALYGLTNAVPDDVFAWLGKYAENCWRRRDVLFEYEKTEVTSSTISVAGGTSAIFKYSQSVYADELGVHLIDPVQISVVVSQSGATDLANLAPCYFVSDFDNYEKIYYLPQNSTGGANNQSTVYFKTASFSPTQRLWLSNVSTIKANEVTFIKSVGDWEFVYSTNRTAYPDSGIQDGYEYEYLGVPFDNLPTAPKIETGSYVGTGTYGASNKNSLTFGFVPRLVIVQTKNGNQGHVRDILMAVQGLSSSMNYTSSSSQYRVYTSWDDKSILWYNSEAAATQLNTSSAEYLYIAIG